MTSPTCPDYAVNPDLFRVLAADEAGITLTESFAMMPAASVSGFYLAHPKAQYFNVGKIGEDQLADVVKRRAWDEQEARRWLAPQLG